MSTAILFHVSCGSYPICIQNMNLNLHGSHRDWKSGKTWKNGKVFFQSGKSQGILLKILEKSGKNTEKVRENCQPAIVKTLQIWYHTLNKKRTLKNTGKLRKILEKSGKFVSRKSGNHDLTLWIPLKSCS